MDSGIFKGRAAFYEYFTAAFYEPATDEFLKLTADFAPHFEAMAEETGDSGIAEGSKELNEFLSSMGENSELLYDLNRSFTSLFLVGDKAVPQVESVYRSVSKLAKQEQWDDIIEIYREYNFGMPSDMVVTEEHMSGELLFMYYMSKRCAEIIDSGAEGLEALVKAQKAFLDEHMLEWMPSVCDKVIASPYDHIILYRSLAKLLQAFLIIDRQLLDEF